MGARINDFALSAHFRLREFECRCCGTVKLSARLVERLEALRARRGAPVLITSGYRCPRHNAAVGGVENSRHMRGTAADIHVEPDELERLVELARGLGFVEVVRGRKRHLHLAVEG